MTDRVNPVAYLNPRYLTFGHPLRNTNLLDLRAEFKHSAWTEFRAVTAEGGKFADRTYNDLSRGWTDFYQWRVPNQEAK